jgi:DNA-binding response OmpR family regulator
LHKLLLLEDDLDLSNTLIRYLTKHGYEVDWAKNGERAMDLTYDNRYDLYLFDINVPLMNGIDLLAALREAGDHTPTIIISALVDISSVTQGFIAGADDYLKKPFDPEELLIRIKAKTSTLQKIMKVKEFKVYTQNEEIFYHGKPLILGEVQKNILLALLRNHPNPVTKDELMLFLEKKNDLALRVNITKMKKNYHIPIGNVRGVGYKII